MPGIKGSFLGDSTSSKGEERNKISTQTRKCKARNFQNGSFNCPKGVQSCLLAFGVEMSLRGIRYLLNSENFKAKRKVKANFVNAINYQPEKAYCLGQKPPELYCG